jgi:hypothetical protein
MGGKGSGTWLRKNTRAVCDGCLYIDINQLAQKGLLIVNVPHVLQLTDTYTGNRLASMAYDIVRTGDDSLLLRLRYFWNGVEDIYTQIRLSVTEPGFGGHRWWMLCPMSTGASPCSHRVSKLYFYDGYFGCRTCHNLTYRSSIESHAIERIVDRWLRTNRR